MAAEWGKKAMGRIDRSQFENDELLKSLGNQLNVDFSNYDQWQRKEKKLRPPAPSRKLQGNKLTFVKGKFVTLSIPTIKKTLRGAIYFQQNLIV